MNFNQFNLLHDLEIVHATLEYMLSNTRSESTELSSPDIERYVPIPDTQVGAVCFESSMEATPDALEDVHVEEDISVYNSGDVVRKEVGGLVVTLKKKLKFLAIRSKLITREQPHHRRKERFRKRRRKEVSLRSI